MGPPSIRNFPAEPRSVEETNLSLAFLATLALKTMYTRGFLRGQEIADSMHLPFANVVDRVLDYLRHEHLTEVRGSTGYGESSYQYAITDEGRARAREFMEHSQYVGPAPVHPEAYTQMVKSQSLAGQPITRDALKHVLSHLVLSNAIINRLGPAINSGRSIFLFGEPGNGKTSIAEAIGELLPGAIWVPHAISLDEYVIRVFDALHHRELPEKTNDDAPGPGMRKGERYDRRWVLIKRPLIAVGGELALEDLDLVFDPTMKYYEAPYQMRANGGVFLVDDFGRQQVRPRDLLNRWIVPLEKSVDYLTLTTGHKIDVPFDTLVIFATNLNPNELADEAFLRRIQYKIHITNPTWEEYREIFMREAAKRSIPYSDNGLRYIVMEYYVKGKRQPRGVHARDILDKIAAFARFYGIKPTLSKELVDIACQSYFMEK
jgi:predicted ATPase with chaperone activity